MPLLPFGSAPVPNATTTKAGKVIQPLTTKGDIQAFSTVITRQGVGTDGQVLMADSTTATGLKYAAASATSHVTEETPSGTINGSNTSFTLANAPISGTLKLYLNGQRLTYTTDFTLSGTTITMVTAPITNDILRADYSISAGDFAVGSASWSNNETPSGLVNSSNTTYTLAAAPITNSLALYRDGQLLTGGGADYTLTTNSISFVTAPTTGSVLLAFYQSAASSAGNATYVNGLTASDTFVSGALITDFGGWQKPPSGTLTYATAQTITSGVDLTVVMRKGDKVRWKQGAGYKYGNLASDPTSTLLTIITNTDYTVANSAITDFYYSHQENPIGFPSGFKFTSTTSGSGGSIGTYAEVVYVSRYSVNGSFINVRIAKDISNKGSWSGNFITLVPITSRVDGTDIDVQRITGFVTNVGDLTSNALKGLPFVFESANILFSKGVGSSEVQWSDLTATIRIELNGSYEF